jgi:hypothetical protein
MPAKALKEKRRMSHEKWGWLRRGRKIKGAAELARERKARLRKYPPSATVVKFLADRTLPKTSSELSQG